MKKITAWTALFTLLCACLCACNGKKGDVPITINSTPISGEIFSYFLYESFGDPAAADKSGKIDYATRGCIRYLAVNTAFERRGLALTPGERVGVSEETNALWRIFGARWETAGISKETVYKLRTSHAYEEKLRTALFDTDGETPVDESVIWAYYIANFVAVRYVEGVLPADAEGGPNEAEKLNAAYLRFDAAARELNAGESFSAVAGALTDDETVEVKQSPRVAVLYNGDPAYPQGFYAACAGIAEGSAAAFAAENSVYLAQREPISSDYTWYRMKRPACFLAVSEPYLQNELNTLCGLYSAVRHSAAVERCYETVTAARGA